MRGAISTIVAPGSAAAGSAAAAPATRSAVTSMTPAAGSMRNVASAVFFPFPPPRSTPSTWMKLRRFTLFCEGAVSATGRQPLTWRRAVRILVVANPHTDHAWTAAAAGTEEANATHVVQVEDPPRHRDAGRPGLRGIGDHRRRPHAGCRHPAPREGAH